MPERQGKTASESRSAVQDSVFPFFAPLWSKDQQNMLKELINKMKTCVIYARYSSSSQTEQSIEGQLTVCRKFAQENDVAIVGEYIDRAMTGTNDHRPSFQRMLKDSEKAQWEIVLVYAIDRFGRNAIEIAINKKKLKDNGKILISATQRMADNIDGSKNLDGILIENLYIGMAEYYSVELAEKILRGLQESRKKGQYCGGILPYGYIVKDKHIFVDDIQAEIVKLMYCEYAKGVKVPQIICLLNERGVLHKGKPFLPNAVYGILRNEKYIGICRYGEEIYDNIYPQIVDVELFQKVQKRLEKNKSGKKPSTTTYLLRGKLKCGYCGMPISAECGTSHTGVKKHYYKCLGKKKYKQKCEKTPVRKEELEEFVLEIVLQALSSDEVVNKIVEGIFAEQERQNRDNYALNNLQAELKQVETALHNVMKAIEQGIISNTTNKRLHELEDRQQELEQQIAIEKAKSTVLLSKQDIRNYYIQALRLEPQMLFNYMIKEIVLYNDKIEIIYNSPLRTSPDESSGFSFHLETRIFEVYQGYKFDYDRIEMLIEMIVV